MYYVPEVDRHFLNEGLLAARRFVHRVHLYGSSVEVEDLWKAQHQPWILGLGFHSLGAAAGADTLTGVLTAGFEGEGTAGTEGFGSGSEAEGGGGRSFCIG